MVITDKAVYTFGADYDGKKVRYVPINSKVKVKLGQKVKNSVDVLAEI